MKSSAAKFFLLVLGVVLTAVGIVIVQSIDQPSPPGTLREVDGMPVVDLTGEINSGLQQRVARALGDLEEHGAKGVVLVLDSPGGNVAAAVELAETLNKSPLRTIALVGNSCGSSVLLVAAIDHINCTPTAVIGAAAPVMAATGSGAPDAMAAKVSSYMTAKIRAFVMSNGHDPELLAAFVDPATTLTRDGKVVKPRGAILTLTAKEALELKLSEGTFPTVEALIAHLKTPVAATTP